MKSLKDFFYIAHSFDLCRNPWAIDLPIHQIILQASESLLVLGCYGHYTIASYSNDWKCIYFAARFWALPFVVETSKYNGLTMLTNNWRLTTAFNTLSLDKQIFFWLFPQKNENLKHYLPIAVRQMGCALLSRYWLYLSFAFHEPSIINDHPVNNF